MASKSDKSDNSKTPKKRGPGRPRKKAKTASIDIEEVLNDQKAEEFQDAIVQSNELTQSIEKQDSEKWIDTIESQITELTQKIEKADKYFNEVKSSYNQYRRQENRINKEQLLMKRLIDKDQDKILQAETKMKDIDPDAYRADLPNIFRPLVRFLTKKEDEILLRREIAECEARISQRTSRVIQINENLAKVLIAVEDSVNKLNTARGIIDDYRAVRMNFGRLQREIQNNFKKQQDQQNQDFILENYIANMEKLKNITADFSTKFAEDREKLTNMFTTLTTLPFNQLSDNLNLSSIQNTTQNSNSKEDKK